MRKLREFEICGVFLLATFFLTNCGSGGGSHSSPPSFNGPGATTKSVDLTWTASPALPPVTGYNAYRGTTAGGPYQPLPGNPSNNCNGGTCTFTDSNAVVGQTYFYVVTAVDPSGESNFTNEVMVKIQ